MFTGWIDKAGPHNVEVHPCPDYAGDVDRTTPAKGVLHTTEGGWEGSMSVFKRHYAPHFMVGRDRDGKVRIAQLLPLGRSGAALAANNRAVRAQVEIVGFSQRELWRPEPSTFDALAWLMAALVDTAEIPLVETHPKRAPTAYAKALGWMGHDDVPGNDHWDPGALDYPALLSAARARAGAPSPAPDHGNTLRLAIGGRLYAGWAACRGPILWVARNGAKDPKAAIAWRGNVWRGPKDVTNVCKALAAKYLGGTE